MKVLESESSTVFTISDVDGGWKLFLYPSIALGIFAIGILVESGFLIGASVLWGVVIFLWTIRNGTTTITVEHDEKGNIFVKQTRLFLRDKFSSLSRSQVKKVFLHKTWNQEGHTYHYMAIGAEGDGNAIDVDCDGWSEDDQYATARLISQLLNVELSHHHRG